MDLDHALELADELKELGYNSLSDEAIVFLADQVRKLMAAEEYWRLIAKPHYPPNGHRITWTEEQT